MIRDAGGKIVGRTRLQKLAYFLELAGLGEGFAFEYRHYGPYSEDLASAAQLADFLGYLDEAETPTNWGGFYSVYTTEDRVPVSADHARLQIAKRGAMADPIELELAATAAFFAAQGHTDPWGETAKRKPEKATESRLSNAKLLYKSLQSVKAPKSLPDIV
jgi:hypothetical protein